MNATHLPRLHFTWIGLAVALLAACAMGGSGNVSASEICANAGVQQGELHHDGRNRSYRVYLPRAASSGKVPLVVAMHGGLGTGENLAEQSGLDAKAEQYGFAVVYPDGVWRSWNAGNCCGRAMNIEVDDVGFIRKLVGEIGGQSCIDGGKVFATGFSNGAMLSHRLACEAPELFTAIAPVAGGPMLEACARPRPMPALFIVGKLDENIPWKGGVYRDTYRPSIAEQVKAFAARNGCAGGEADIGSGTCGELKGCSRGDVRWCVVDGVGHQWPGGQTLLQRLLGPNNQKIDAADVVMRFFAAQE